MNEIFENQKNEVAAEAATQVKKTQPSQAQLMREFQDKTVNAVLDQIMSLQSEGKLKIPANYSPGNELKMAWLTLLETTDRNQVPAIEACTRESIINALLKMTLQGLSVAKKQAAFVVYGKKLELQIEYHGTVALARRYGGIIGIPKANVVYEKDDFLYTIDTETGRKKILKHEQSIANIDPNKIVAAYAVITEADGTTNVEIMSMQQIRQAWMQGATKGQSPAHKNFPDQMAMKTVIGRACKLYITTSDEGGMIEDEEREVKELPAPPKNEPKREVIDTEYTEEAIEAVEPKQKEQKIEVTRNPGF